MYKGFKNYDNSLDIIGVKLQNLVTGTNIINNISENLELMYKNTESGAWYLNLNNAGTYIKNGITSIIENKDTAELANYVSLGAFELFSYRFDDISQLQSSEAQLRRKLKYSMHKAKHIKYFKGALFILLTVSFFLIANFITNNFKNKSFTLYEAV